MYTVVEGPLVPSYSHSLVLDHNFDLDTAVNTNIGMGIDHLSLPIIPPPGRSHLRILLPVRGPVILPAAITASSSPYSYSTPEAKEALGSDEGHEMTS
jgi:hypothetical protein